MRSVSKFAVALVLLASACTNDDGSNGDRSPVTQPEPSDTGRKGCGDLDLLVERFRRGWFDGGSPELGFIPAAPNYVGNSIRPSHSGPWPYVQDVPLLLYGPPVVKALGNVDGPATIADIAPTIARIVAFDGWPRRAGRVLTEGLKPTRPPRLIVTIVWDGGGTNVLRQHQSSWPFLKSLIPRGTFYSRASVGSSPSVTPAVHTTLGTGTWPSRHGIHAINQRLPEGEIGDPLLFYDPAAIQVPTLADLYDQELANKPIMALLASSNWHLGMVGHGSQLPGGDKDPVALLDENGFLFTNDGAYSLPSIGDRARLLRLIHRLDISDGRQDDAWKGDNLFGDDSLTDVLVKKGNPARVKYEEWLLEEFVSQGRLGSDSVPDLLFVNFKAADEAGHRWGISSAQVADVVAEQDRALRRLVGFLNREVGRKRWVLFLTADHGQTPSPEDSGAWPIGVGELVADANREFDETNNGVPIAQEASASGLFLDEEEMESGEVTKSEIARWLTSYSVGQNARAEVPDGWQGRKDERLFHAVLTGGRVAHRNC